MSGALAGEAEAGRGWVSPAFIPQLYSLHMVSISSRANRTSLHGGRLPGEATSLERPRTRIGTVSLLLPLLRQSRFNGIGIRPHLMKGW